MPSIRGPRGTADILPEDAIIWQYVEDEARSVCRRYDFGEVRTPIFEHTELFTRIGESTDVVTKEMYTFLDKGGRSLTLRPEGTAAAVRALLQHQLVNGPLPVKWYYLGPMFRYERPQSGRMRQFTQFGVEVFGAPGEIADAEVICLAMDYLTGVGLTSLRLEINSLGCEKCRPQFRAALVDFLMPRKGSLCEDCVERLEKNPLRVLDCKSESCKKVVSEAPSPIDFLCEACRHHFERTQELLKAAGISFEINPRIVRGLDYYTRTVFEVIHDKLGAQGTVCGGGRYDNLIQELGGPSMPAVGFGLGLDRLVLSLKEDKVPLGLDKGLDAYVVYQEGYAREAFFVLRRLRADGLSADIEMMDRSLKAQMKQAGRLNSAFAVIIGERETGKGVATVKDMQTGEQKEIPVTDVSQFIREAKR